MYATLFSCSSEVHTVDLALDPALVRPTQDLEETAVTPLLVPGVLHKPVLGAGVHTPADDLNGVAAQGRPAGVAVHTALVGREVSVHGERSGHRPLRQDAVHDVGLPRKRVRLRRLRLVARVVLRVRLLAARLRALRRRVLRRRALRVLRRRVHVVRARRQRVRPARRPAPDVRVVPAGHHTSLRHPRQSRTGLPTVAPLGQPAREPRAARRGVLTAELNVLTRRHTPTVLERLRRAERPAAPARRLVAHLRDHRALRPLRPRVEVRRQRLRGQHLLVLLRQGNVLRVVLQPRPAQRLRLLHRPEPLRARRSPSRSRSVHLPRDRRQLALHLHRSPLRQPSRRRAQVLEVGALAVLQALVHRLGRAGVQGTGAVRRQQPRLHRHTGRVAALNDSATATRHLQALPDREAHRLAPGRARRVRALLLREAAGGRRRGRRARRGRRRGARRSRPGPAHHRRGGRLVQTALVRAVRETDVTALAP
eukprot:Hpha_TRINITY_DN16930_c1_g3::TRINITY_DN16930_c1_g3_i1::g.53588::m.53588